MASFLDGKGFHQGRYGILNIDNSGSGIDSTLRVVQDWGGTECPLYISTTKLEVKPSANSTTAFEVSQADGTAILTVNSTTPGFTVTGTLAATGNANFDGNFNLAGIEVLDGTPQTLTGAGAVNITTAITWVVTTGADALTLADGAEGQRKLIVMKTDGGAGTLTPTNLANGTTITFDDVGDCAELTFTNAAWHMHGGTATLA